jgi:hypothetical protein
MTFEADTEDRHPSGAIHTWSERNIRPAILLYVVGVFAGFLALAQFVFRSAEAVEALVLAALASVGATVPGTLKRIEYQLSSVGLSKRPVVHKQPRDFVEVFAWKELSHLVPTKSGFKYYKELEEPNRLRRFTKLHLLSDCSGEFQVGPENRREVEAIIDRQGIPRNRPVRVIKGGH